MQSQKTSPRTLLLMLLLAIGAFFLMITLSNWPVPRQATEANTTVVVGKLIDVSICCEGGDVQFQLEGFESSFYVNRGLDAGFDLRGFELEVPLGSTVYIRAFSKYLRENPRDEGRLEIIPSAEIATAEKVYFSTMVDLE